MVEMWLTNKKEVDNICGKYNIGIRSHMKRIQSHIVCKTDVLQLYCRVNVFFLCSVIYIEKLMMIISFTHKLVAAPHWPGLC